MNYRNSSAVVVSLPRALSKLGYCSRTQAQVLIRAGRVKVNGIVVKSDTRRIDLRHDVITINDAAVQSAAKMYLMFNKPRGVVTTIADEQGRKTVYDCLPIMELPWLSPVGRLDKASEGLLLFTNDTEWAAGITAPESGILKTYHVQIAEVASTALLVKLRAGIVDHDAILTVKRVEILRCGERTSWLEIVLDEGKNRHIRRMLAVCGIEVLRLVRVAIGKLRLGDLPKGQYRYLCEDERKFDAFCPARPSVVEEYYH